MDLIRDIADIVKDDKYHNIKISIEYIGVTVFISDNRDEEYEDKCVIPIRYDTLTEDCYIPHDELLDMFQPNDGGISYEDIVLIEMIMKYLRTHKSEIIELCDSMYAEARDKSNDESE